MKVTLFYADSNYTAHFRTVRDGSCVLFGSGSKADFGVSGSNVADVHFQVMHDGEFVVLKKLVSAMAPVLVNGEEVTETELSNGDSIVVANTEVRVRIDGVAQPVAEEAPEAARFVVSGEEAPTGLLRWYDPDSETTLGEALARLLEKFDPLLMANFKAAQETPPAFLAEADDLLGGSPKEVSAENSLHLIAADDIPLEAIPPAKVDENEDPPQAAELLRLFHKLRTQSAATLLLGDASKDDTLDAIKFHRGFFSTAKGLEMFLGKGSADLAEKLMAVTSAVLIAGPGDFNWAVYANPKLAPEAADLGFEDGVPEQANTPPAESDPAEEEDAPTEPGDKTLPEASGDDPGASTVAM